jgi:hypothetical protein
MGLVDRISKLAGISVVQRGSVTLVESEAAEFIIYFCERENIPILGVDGFRMSDRNLIPDMSAIADFSSVSSVDSIHLARRFANANMRPGLWYEFAFGSNDD